MDGTVDLDLLTRFVAVAETSSFSAAAKRLGVPKSSVSRGVTKLEEELGTELLHRTTRHVALSTAGAALYERTAPLLVSLRQAVGCLPEREEEPSGELRVTAPMDLGVILLADVIGRFTLRYPKVRVDVDLTNRHVDLIAEGFDLAIRAAALPLKDSSLAMRKLSPVELQCFAAPTYLARRGTPSSVGDPAHDWVLFRKPITQQLGFPANFRPRVLCHDYLFLRETLRAGAGVGFLPTFLAEPYVVAGSLQRVLPTHRVRIGGFVLLYPSTRVPRKVLAFRDLLLEAIKSHPIA
jgi:DNA-binding transcriptional LysR family regulator